MTSTRSETLRRSLSSTTETDTVIARGGKRGPHEPPPARRGDESALFYRKTVKNSDFFCPFALNFYLCDVLIQRARRIAPKFTD